MHVSIYSFHMMQEKRFEGECLCGEGCGEREGVLVYTGKAHYIIPLLRQSRKQSARRTPIDHNSYGWPQSADRWGSRLTKNIRHGKTPVWIIWGCHVFTSNTKPSFQRTVVKWNKHVCHQPERRLGKARPVSSPRTAVLPRWRHHFSLCELNVFI